MRRIMSVLLLLLFLLLSVSGLQMAFSFKDKSFFSLQQPPINHDSTQVTSIRPKNFYPKEMHEWAGFLFIGAGLVHIGLNRKSIWLYLKHGNK